MGKKERSKKQRKPSQREETENGSFSALKKRNSLQTDKVKKTPKKSTNFRYVAPFERNHRLLLIGEGNFSFAASLQKHHLDDEAVLIATCYDTKADVELKYPDASEYIEQILQNGGEILYDVDATKLKQNKKFRNQKFDTILWNFPHSGKGIKDQDRNILDNQKMLLEFFKQSKEFLSEKGVIVITLAETKPYNLWNLKGLAKEAGFVSLMTEGFDSSFYPEYSHRRTIGWKQGISEKSNWKGELRDSRHYCFVLPGSNVVPYNQRKTFKEKSDSVDSSDDSID
ncbi:ribosome biogenesis protein [Schizosaccharomyces cryophilus OY26]|uniref:Ribosome biogenesis protein n=1 Tax=Schizosaccharomyces cryophilus (strain OY26 / ATCC MYA-4695 / CBS 11777 / NBRC 106824 / NRRL Y48691) TaxID=653667 RepID=S9X219_SCHCR|nr:ribosome biogenesis protein [Schizosaccharomyces cryophilus OY26]EPY51157.1 ribosome biogenesis protein [Schizosaccharomyces cryophilus OY26]